jgi:FxsC-like protein
MLNLGDQYETVITRLGRRIVEIATGRPLPPSRVSALYEVSSAFRYKGSEDDFVVAVAAPTRSTAPAGRAVSWYGETGTDWRPFGAREQLRLAEHAVAVAERLNFSTAILSVRAAAEETVAAPAVVLIDPWIAAATAEGAESDALKNLRRLYSGEQRRWALPLLVLNADDPESATRQRTLIERLTHVLQEIGAAPANALRRGSDIVTSIEGFSQVLPALVAEAERRYLKYGRDHSNDPSGEG